MIFLLITLIYLFYYRIYTTVITLYDVGNSNLKKSVIGSCNEKGWEPEGLSLWLPWTCASCSTDSFYFFFFNSQSLLLAYTCASFSRDSFYSDFAFKSLGLLLLSSFSTDSFYFFTFKSLSPLLPWTCASFSTNSFYLFFFFFFFFFFFLLLKSLRR